MSVEMSYMDLIVGSVLLPLVYLIAYFIRPAVSDKHTRIYYFPALTLKILGALLLGFLYFYYYKGGDTVAYYTGASRIWEIFVTDPVAAIKVILSDGTYSNGLYKYTNRIPQYTNLPAFFVVRIAAIFGILTFNTYTGIAILFAALSFSGSWALFSALKNLHPDRTSWIALACLFIPSVIFWGSGVLKDTVTFAALGWVIWAFANMVEFKRRQILALLIFLLSVWIIFHVKKYILFCLIPSLLFWVYIKYIKEIRYVLIRVFVAPLLIAVSLLLSFQAVDYIGRNDERYSLDRIAETAAITAFDIRYWTGKDAGSGYDIGQIESTWDGLLRRAPAAVNVSLFRPYFWEVASPLMAIASLESAMLFLITVILIGTFLIKKPGTTNVDPMLVFCLVFSISFAFAVGVSTYNFGTLMRYKIPMMPFYIIFLVLLSKTRKA